MTDTKPVTVETEAEFTQSASKQLALFALYTVAALAALIYALNVAAGGVGSRASGGAVDLENNSITITLRDEPPQLDSSRATDAASFTVLNHVMEGLIAYDEKDRLIPGQAERWEIREDGATFWIRDEAMWSDGVPVTAHDFVYSWRRVLDPATGSEYSFIMYPIKNAEAINQGELPIEMLGVRAVSDKILEVEFERPTPYFDKLAAYVTYNPMREDFTLSTNGRYGADADVMIFNGPYLLTEWVHGSSMRWEKNPLYWNPTRGLLDEVVVAYITSDVNAKLNLFKDGQIAETDLVAPMLPEAMQQHWHIQRTMDGTVFFMEFNHREGRLTENLNLRKALLLAQDPVELVNKVLKEPGYLPAKSLFPVWLPGVNGTMRQEYPPPEHHLNLEKAREHLELAKQELGVEEIPPLVLLAGDTPVSVLSAEYYQELYQKNLGLEFRIDIQTFKQRLAKMTSGDFDLVLAGWGPDYFDPLTFGDLFSSWNLNNRGRYESEEMDRMIRIAQSELDPRARMDAFGRIQELAYEDAIIIPMYERGWSFVVDPRLKGMIRRIVGAEVDYNYAYLDVSDQ